MEGKRGRRGDGEKERYLVAELVEVQEVFMHCLELISSWSDTLLI
jgi:hypothetical protein